MPIQASGGARSITWTSSFSGFQRWIDEGKCARDERGGGYCGLGGRFGRGSRDDEGDKKENRGEGSHDNSRGRNNPFATICHDPFRRDGSETKYEEEDRDDESSEDSETKSRGSAISRRSERPRDHRPNEI